MRRIVRMTSVLAVIISAPAATAGGTLFEAHLDGVQVVPPTGSPHTGYAIMEYVPGVGGPTLSYHISLPTLDLDGQQTPNDPLDDVTAIHIHYGVFGEEGGHALNIFGLPREDDADMTFNAAEGWVMGLWDDGDENLAPPPSFSLTASLDELFAHGLYIQVHTAGFPDGEIRGQIVMVPGVGGLGVLAGCGLVRARRRRC